MEENVALDSTKQRKFNRSIKGIKKLLKKNEEKPHKPAVLAPKDDENKEEKKKKKRPSRGLVYLSHIPHGFYEHEMTQYFKQFGMVTKVRVIRSPRTGRSKGYAFVEFREPAVAEIVAETMNNYLMGKRLIKAAIIPPEKQKHKAFRKHWSTKHNPTVNRRIKERKAHNADKSDAEHLKKAKKMLQNLQKTKKKLSDIGIEYDFFKPVDVPKSLSDVNVKTETEEKQKKKKKTNPAQTAEKLTKEKKPETKPKSEGKGKNEVKKPQEGDKVKQNAKQKKMQAAGVKLPENFIKVAEEEDSDSSLDFDSDEYEKMLANDSEASSGDESDDDEEESDDGDEDSDAGGEDGDDDEEEGSDDEESEEEMPQLIPIQKKGKKHLIALPQPKKTPKGANGPKAQKPQPLQPKKDPKPVPQGKKAPAFQQGVKRKNLQSETSPKKPKFEKQDKKPRNKQFKKKNKA